MLSQLFHVGDQMRGGVALKARIEGTGVWRAPTAVALIEEHEAVGALIKQPAVPGCTSRTRAAVQDDGWLAMWIATGLPVDEIAAVHFQEALLAWFDLRIQLGSQLSRESGSPFPMLKPVYHTSCHRRKWPYLLSFRLLSARWISRGEGQIIG